MKSLLLVFVAVFCLNATAEAVGVVDQSKYTCEQLSDYLDQKGEFYVKSFFGPSKINFNGCTNAQLERNCRDVYDYVNAKDGYCEIGLACSCPPKKHKKKHGHKHKKATSVGGGSPQEF